MGTPPVHPGPKPGPTVAAPAADATSGTVHAEHAEGLRAVVLGRAWRALWRHLAALSVAAVVTALAVVLGFLLGSLVPVLLPLVIALVAGPTLMPLLAVAQDALVEDDTAVGRYPGFLRRFALHGTGHALLAAVPLTALLAALEVYGRTSQSLWLISVASAGTASVLAAGGLMVVLPAAVARPGLSIGRLWTTALHLLGRWPIRFLAAAVACLLPVWPLATVSSSLVLLLAAPAAVVVSAAYWCCAIDLGATDVAATT